MIYYSRETDELEDIIVTVSGFMLPVDDVAVLKVDDDWATMELMEGDTVIFRTMDVDRIKLKRSR